MDPNPDSLPETRFVLAPNGSLSVRGAWLFMGLASLATLGCAGICTWLGFWPVLPFAGLELAALGWALGTSIRRSRYREVVVITEVSIRIESGMAGRGVGATVEWPRAWTRARLERGVRDAASSLVLGRAGQRIVIGRFLTEDERQALAVRLQCALRSGPMQPKAVPAAQMTLGDG